MAAWSFAQLTAKLPLEKKLDLLERAIEIADASLEGMPFTENDTRASYRDLKVQVAVEEIIKKELPPVSHPIKKSRKKIIYHGPST